MTGLSLPRGRRLLAGGAVLVAALLAAGCGSSKGEVSGKVTFNGEAVGSGLVTFHGSHSVVAAPIAADGTFTASKVPAESVKITVETMPPPPGGGSTGKSGVQHVGMGAADSPGDKPAGKYVKIPPKYSLPSTSGLSLDVKSGRQQHDIALTP